MFLEPECILPYLDCLEQSCFFCRQYYTTLSKRRISCPKLNVSIDSQQIFSLKFNDGDSRGQWIFSDVALTTHSILTSTT